MMSRRRSSDPNFSAGEGGVAADVHNEQDGDGWESRRSNASSARPRRVLPQPPNQTSGGGDSSGSGSSSSNSVQNHHNRHHHHQQHGGNSTANDPESHSLPRSVRTRGVPRSNSDGNHIYNSGGGSSRPTSGWDRSINRGSSSNSPAGTPPSFTPPATSAVSMSAHQVVLAEAMSEVANGGGGSGSSSSSGPRPMSRIGTANRRSRGHRRQRSLPSYELKGLSDAIIAETTELADVGRRAANISPLANSWAPGEGAAALAAFAGLSTSGSNGSFDGTQSLRMPSASSKVRSFRHSRSIDDSLELSKMASARRTKKRFDLRKSMSEINPTDVRAARNQMSMSASGFSMLRNTGSDSNIAERGSARGARGKHSLMLGGSAMGIPVPMPATPFGNGKSLLGKSLSPDAVALLPRIELGKISPINVPTFLPPIQLPSKQNSPETVVAALIRPEPMRRAESSGRASPEELMAAADAIAAGRLSPPTMDEPEIDPERDGNSSTDDDVFLDTAPATTALVEELPAPAPPPPQQAQTRARKRRGSLSESALRYLDYLSTVCVVPFDKLDQYRVALGLGGPNDSLISQLALKLLLEAVVEGKQWSANLLNYAMAVLDFTPDVDAIERDFRLYAVALLVETVFDLPESTKAMVEKMDLDDTTVTQIFGLAKRAFLSLDARRSGHVNLDALFETLHADSAGAVDAASNALTQLSSHANEANEISLLDLLSNLVHFVDGRDLFGALQPSASFFKKMDGNRGDRAFQKTGSRSRPTTAGREEPH